MNYVIPFEQLNYQAIPVVGGKNASLGEMISHLTGSGIRVPKGFATTVLAYQTFLKENKLDEKIYNALAGIDIEDVSLLSKRAGAVRAWIQEGSLSTEFIDAVTLAYEGLGGVAVAVRSSATAEDLPKASFAGQQESFLNVCGIAGVLDAIKRVFASLYNERAIAYRVHHNFAHESVGISCGIQHMVRSDLASSGVMFSMDTESGFDKVVFITASYGLGETIVQGRVNPDEFYVHKDNLSCKRPSILRRHLGLKQEKMVYDDAGVKLMPVSGSAQLQYAITDEEVTYLAEQARIIEAHYQRPMDIEWAKDGVDSKIYIVQARPETVKSHEDKQVMLRYELTSKGPLLVEGRSVGQKIGTGFARVIAHYQDRDQVQPGDVIVTDMTDPDWEPVMKRAAAIVTNRGGRTCHAAIIARELGIPAIVGCVDATEKIADKTPITVSCAQGDTGYVYEGIQTYQVHRHAFSKMPSLPFQIMMNIANPDRAFDFQALPNHGVGLVRLEFIISQLIGIHPKACLQYQQLDPTLQREIKNRCLAYKDPKSFYVSKLTEGISMLAAAFSPKPVIVRLSDFKSNEYANLVGGAQFEPTEENPMMGFRGAGRYIAPEFEACFALECEALKYVRNEMGFENVSVMVPFVRTLTQAKQVVAALAKQGLVRGERGLRVIMMCELPSNALLAESFLEYFDGFSIGSNDLTQLTLGVDRDSALVADDFDERDEAVKVLLHRAIMACKKAKKYVGICGQGPSDHPELAQWLMKEGIDSVSLNPDTVVQTWHYLAQPEKIEADLCETK